MIKTVQFLVKYHALLPVLADFITVCIRSTHDGRITKKEKSLLLSQYWKLVKAIRQSAN